MIDPTRLKHGHDEAFSRRIAFNNVHNIFYCCADGEGKQNEEEDDEQTVGDDGAVNEEGAEFVVMTG